MGSNHISDILVSHEYMTLEQQHQMHQHQLNPNVNSEHPTSPIDLQEGSSRPVRRASQRTTQVVYYMKSLSHLKISLFSSSVDKMSELEIKLG